MAKKFEVFLSYNREDRPAVHAVATALRDRGLEGWLDEWVLVPRND